MPSQTGDLEYAITEALTDGPLTLTAMEDRIPYVGDRRWVAVALVHLRQDDVIRYPDCSPEHSHNGGCTVELA